MDKNQYGFVLTLSVIIALGVVSFALCIACEFIRTKRKDLKLNGRLCYLPESRALGFGIAALICLFLAQIIGSSITCRNFCSGGKRTSCKARKPTVASSLQLLSWISLGIAVILIGAATSMNRRQPYGEGWLDSKCYVVKDGVYAGSAMLVLVTVGSTLASAIITIRKSHVEQGLKANAQV